MALFGVDRFPAILDPMQIHRANGIEGAATAQGATVVVDVFRAYSAAAYAFAAGAAEIVLTSDVGEALQIAAKRPGAILMGEVDGVRPAQFHLGNSPGEIVARPGELTGRTIVHRSTAGTRAARAALAAGADPLYVSSLVVASATAAALVDEEIVTLVASGLSGTEPSQEDDLCVDLLAQLLRGDRSSLALTGATVAATDRARYLSGASFAHPDDVRLCCDTDRFSFAMKAQASNGLVFVSAIE